MYPSSSDLSNSNSDFGLISHAGSPALYLTSGSGSFSSIPSFSTPSWEAEMLSPAEYQEDTLQPHYRPYDQMKRLQQEVLYLRSHSKGLEKKNLVLEAQCNMLRDNYNSLLKRVSPIPSLNGAHQDDAQANIPTALTRENYPNIKFWTKRQWTESSSDKVTDVLAGSRGRARAAQGINVAMRYVELEDGTMINGDRAGEIRKFARSIWVSFSKKGPPPPKWGQADIEMRKTYCKEMGNRFPELTYCDLDWKADQIATDNYPSWYVNWLPKSETVQMKEEDGETGTHTKRSRKASTKTANKRTKTADVDDMQIDSGMVASLITIPTAPSGLQIDPTTVPSGLQVNPATVAATAAPTGGLQMNSLNSKAIVGGVANFNEMQQTVHSGLQIDLGTVAPLATPTAVTVEDMQIDPKTVAATAAPSGLQMNFLNSKAIVGVVANVDEMQIEHSGIQIDPGMVAPLATPSAPCILEVPADDTPEPSHASASPCIISEGHSTTNITGLTALTAPSKFHGPADDTLEPSHASASPGIVSEGHSTTNLTGLTALTAPSKFHGPADDTPEPSHASASPHIVSKGHSTTNLTGLTALTAPSKFHIQSQLVLPNSVSDTLNMLVSAASSGPHPPLVMSTLAASPLLTSVDATLDDPTGKAGRASPSTLSAPPMSATSKTIPQASPVLSITSTSMIKDSEHQSIVTGANDLVNPLSCSTATSANMLLPILTHKPPDMVAQGGFMDGTGTALPTTTTTTKKPKSTRMRPGTTTTARNLCSQDWCLEHPGGTRADFKAFFDNLPSEKLKEYEDLSAKYAEGKKRMGGIGAPSGSDAVQ